MFQLRRHDTERIHRVYSHSTIDERDRYAPKNIFKEEHTCKPRTNVTALLEHLVRDVLYKL